MVCSDSHRHADNIGLLSEGMENCARTPHSHSVACPPAGWECGAEERGWMGTDAGVFTLRRYDSELWVLASAGAGMQWRFGVGTGSQPPSDLAHTDERVYKPRVRREWTHPTGFWKAIESTVPASDAWKSSIMPGRSVALSGLVMRPILLILNTLGLRR